MRPFLVLNNDLFLGGLLLAACSQGTDEPGLPDRIRLDHLEVGQHSKYARGLSDYRPLSGSVSYTQDVMLVEIVDHDDTGYLVHESLVNPPPDQPPKFLEYYLRIEENKLHALPAPGPHSGSELFYFKNDYVLPLGKVTQPVLEVIGLQTTTPTDAYTEAAVIDTELLGETYPHLNAVVDSRDISVDGPVSTWLYSASQGIVRSTACGVETMRCAAWDLLSE